MELRNFPYALLFSNNNKKLPDVMVIWLSKNKPSIYSDKAASLGQVSTQYTRKTIQQYGLFADLLKKEAGFKVVTLTETELYWVVHDVNRSNF